MSELKNMEDIQTDIFQIRKKNLSVVTKMGFHILCNTGTKEESAIQDQKKIYSEVFAHWQRCISVCICR